ncbi:hypothetical protein BDB01DRAFT_770190 [Pilobolus umbonatus]|nr:hypothetical protein BDB01DRAFT_770190 [Pilobolus umbonatus]
MHQKSIRNSKPKLFQCSGFGDCHMVFTRSEHLARHSRKHTGEKPFKCIVPCCSKSFSRFDNMMQHTQTHRNSSNKGNMNYLPEGKGQIHIDKFGQGTRTLSTRAQTKRGSITKVQTACEFNMKNQTRYPLQNNHSHVNISHPSHLPSPSSPSLSSPVSSSYSSSSDEDDNHPAMYRRRLSVADLCNPISTSTYNTPPPIHLTKDELEALEGISRFRHPHIEFFNPKNITY